MAILSSTSWSGSGPCPLKDSTKVDNNEQKGNNIQGNNGGNEGSSVSIFAKLDANKNNNIEKSEANNTLKEGFKDATDSVFNSARNSISGLTSEDSAVLDSRAPKLKGQISLKSLYDTAMNNFSGIKLEATSVDSADKQKEAQQKVDNDVNKQLTELINQYNNEAQEQYTQQMKELLEQNKQEIQQDRMENTYSNLDISRDHTIDANDVSNQISESMESLQDVAKNLAGTDSQSTTLDVNSYINDAISSFGTIQAKEGVNDTFESFEARVSSQTNSQIEAATSKAIKNFQTDAIAASQKSQNTNTNTTTQQTSNKENVQNTQNQLDGLGARFSKINLNGQQVTQATFQNDQGQVKNVVINSDGSTQDIEQNSNGVAGTKEGIQDAVETKIESLMKNDNAHQTGRNEVSYTDSENRNHTTTVYNKINSDGSAQYSDVIVNSNNSRAEDASYQAAQQKTNISRDVLESLEITPQVNGSNITFVDKHGNNISQEELLKLVEQTE